LPAFRHVRQRRSPARRVRSRRGRDRLDVRAHARTRARLPRRALRRRPARRARADRERARARAEHGAAAGARRTRRAGARGTGAGLMAEDAVEPATRAHVHDAPPAPLDAPANDELWHDDEEMPRVALTRRRVIALVIFVLVAIGFLYFVLPQIKGVKEVYERVSGGDHVWLAVALALELASIASYVALFHGIHVPPGSPLRHRDSYLITMAGLAATRLLAAGGAGGVALTAWALRRSRMQRREVAERMIAFLVVLYGVYVVAMLVCGVGLRTGLFAG